MRIEWELDGFRIPRENDRGLFQHPYRE
jgi:hypothetical protein